MGHPRPELPRGVSAAKLGQVPHMVARDVELLQRLQVPRDRRVLSPRASVHTLRKSDASRRDLPLPGHSQPLSLVHCRVGFAVKSSTPATTLLSIWCPDIAICTGQITKLRAKYNTGSRKANSFADSLARRGARPASDHPHSGPPRPAGEATPLPEPGSGLLNANGMCSLPPPRNP